MWRAARKTPWWYCSRGDCRFDLVEPFGTCYVGTDELAGILEVIGPELENGVVAAEFLDARRLFSFTLSSPAKAADLPSRRAAGFGVTNELSTMTPYVVPCAWAEALHERRFAAIRYRTRFDTSEAARGVAHFGRSGEARRAPGKAIAVDAALRRRLEHECNIQVAPAPAMSDLEIAPDP